MSNVTEPKLSLLDKLLPVWIVAAMLLGVAIGNLFPSLGPALNSIKIADVSLPIAFGLLWMMYPVLTKVKYETIPGLASNKKMFSYSIILNWIIGPALMFGLAWLMLPDMPEYRAGIILVGLARCIAMVLVWNMLAKGSSEIAAILVALNSVFQIFMYSVLGFFYLELLPGWLGLSQTQIQISMWQIAKSVLIYLGIPLLAGYLTRKILIQKKGEAWFEKRFLPKLSPTALMALLYTIILMFSMQGEKIVSLPLDVFRIALPLLCYFLLMWFGAFFGAKALRFNYSESASVAFTAAGNNFELAIAVSAGIFGIASGQSLAAVVGPLIEVPVLVSLVYVSLWAQKFFQKAD
ncbi:MAG TPA: ACR3 family arsenite efflux transporter [Caldisericia bacterium]|nr:MAG: Sodium Bile acid symporter family protein [bacterium ADurb.Bin132]HNW31614.1 ACR3 family arsenite efflux transporter [Caldisericia bacterium]HNY62020.1 ACR3 family arsenite efflux transporter [Caldisericia bacterium]HOC80083.1 ACR3 family arsenite efflux transporter [Caldisericia bacterium]HOG71060.1 ACR3 family arsenite efflux transporter [Caldisericia bacterium]